MKTASCCGLALLVLTTGCSQRTPPTIYLNLAEAAAAQPVVAYAVAPNPTPPAVPGPTQASMPPLAARKLDFSANKSRLAKVEDAVRQAREQAIADQSRKLREAYMKEIDSLEASRTADLSPERKAAYAKVFALMRTRFQKYADDRASDVIRLALLAGRPDPDPTSAKLPPEDGKALVKRFHEASAIRTRLTEVDRVYEVDVRAIIAAADDDIASKLLALRVEIEKLRADAEVRAKKDAEAQVQKSLERTDSILSGKAEVELPPEPGVAASTPAAKPLPRVEGVRMPSAAELIREREEAVLSDAKIWIAQRGATLSQVPSVGTNRTKEFMEWRKRQRLGP